MSLRTERVQSLIKKEVGQIISAELGTPEGLLITVTDVTVSYDIKHATVKVTTLRAADEERVMSFLRENVREIQRLLNKRLVLKFVPKLYFKFDRTGMKSGRVMELLRKIEEERGGKIDNDASEESDRSDSERS